METFAEEHQRHNDGADYPNDKCHDTGDSDGGNAVIVVWKGDCNDPIDSESNVGPAGNN